MKWLCSAACIVMSNFVMPKTASSFQFGQLQQARQRNAITFCDPSSKEIKSVAFVDSVCDQWNKAFSEKPFDVALHHLEVKAALNEWCYDEALRCNVDQLITFSSPPGYQLLNSDDFDIYEVDDPRILELKYHYLGCDDTFTAIAVAENTNIFSQLMGQGWNKEVSSGFIMFDAFMAMTTEDIESFLCFLKPYTEIVFVIGSNTQNALYKWLQKNDITTLKVQSLSQILAVQNAENHVYLIHGFKFIHRQH